MYAAISVVSFERNLDKLITVILPSKMQPSGRHSCAAAGVAKIENPAIPRPDARITEAIARVNFVPIIKWANRSEMY